jgi:uncharacterized membrane protein YhiD involved in acid resistance
VAPALFSSIYAYGVTYQILGGELGIIVLALAAAGFWVACQFLPKQVEDMPKNKDSDVEEQVEGVDVEEEAEDSSTNKSNVTVQEAERQPLLQNGDSEGVVRDANETSR